MSEYSLSFSSERVHEHAQGNLNAFILSSIVLLKRQGQSVEDWYRAVGELFAPGWESAKGQGAMAAARLAALNMVSAGGRVVSASGDDQQASVEMTDWPPADLLDYLGLERQDVEGFFVIFQPIAAHLGLEYSWQVDGPMTTVRFAQR